MHRGMHQLPLWALSAAPSTVFWHIPSTGSPKAKRPPGGGLVAISLSPRNRTFGSRTAALLVPPWTGIDRWPPALPWPNPSQSPSQNRWGMPISWWCRWKRWRSIGRERWRQPRTCICHGIRSVHVLRHRHYLSKTRRPTQRLGRPLHYRAPTLHRRCPNASPESSPRLRPQTADNRVSSPLPTSCVAAQTHARYRHDTLAFCCLACSCSFARHSRLQIFSALKTNRRPQTQQRCMASRARQACSARLAFRASRPMVSSCAVLAGEHLVVALGLGVQASVLVAQCGDGVGQFIDLFAACAQQDLEPAGV